MPDTGKVVATIKNGTRVDALGWDPSKKLIYIPNGGEGNVTVVHQDSPDKYTVVATVATFAGAKTIAVDPETHNVVPLPARARSGSAATRRRPATDGGTWPRPTGSDRRCVVYRDQAVVDPRPEVEADTFLYHHLTGSWTYPVARRLGQCISGHTRVSRNPLGPLRRRSVFE